MSKKSRHKGQDRKGAGQDVAAPSSRALLDQAEAHLRSNRWGQAMSLVQEHLAKSPEDPVAHFLAGTVLVRSGQPSEARVSLRRALEVDPGLLPACLLYTSRCV